MCFHVITVTSDGPLTQHQGLRGHIRCILDGTTRASRECGQFWEKPRYTVNRVPLTKNNLQAPFVARNYSVEYFQGKYTGLFQAFRWAENGVSWEWRENNKRAGIEKESNMSIAQWRPYFHCQGIRPTQLVDPQLYMYFFFILRLLNNFFGNLRITVAWIIKTVTF